MENMNFATDGVGHIPQENATENAPMDIDTPDIRTPVYSANLLNYEYNRLNTFLLEWTHHFEKILLSRNEICVDRDIIKCFYHHLVIDVTADTSGELLGDYHRANNFECEMANGTSTLNAPIRVDSNYR